MGPEPLPEAARAAHLRVWPDGDVLPRILDERTVVVAARGAAAGVAALLGARVLVPDGATGDPASDLESKARAAIAAMTGGAPSVVVHVGGADEAAHARDGAGKVAFIERADRQLIAPLAAAVARAERDAARLPRPRLRPGDRGARRPSGAAPELERVRSAGGRPRRPPV